MLKICTVLSTRPELIRLSRIIAKLDKYCQHTLIYTGQNFDPKLSTIFFEELGIRKPDFHLGNISSNFGEQLGGMLSSIEPILKQIKPDKILFLGDTNGCLCSIIAKKLKIPIFHLEAGNVCGEWISEEINRRIIDSISDVHLPYTEISKQNLLNFGVSNKDIFVVGNPINEVLSHYSKEISSSKVISELGLKSKEFFLATFHRNENVTDQFILNNLVTGLGYIAKEYSKEVVCSIHPKTRTNLDKFAISCPKGVRFVQPLGFFDFINLEKNCIALISDSGTVPEEGTILGVPSIIIRNCTERPELIQCGSVILSGTNSCDILNYMKTMLNCGNSWVIPVEYTYLDVSDRVVKLLLGSTR